MGVNSVPAMDARKDEVAQQVGETVMRLVTDDLRPERIVTREALENAVAAVALTGGSTNAVLHLLAIARDAGVPLRLWIAGQGDDRPRLERLAARLDLGEAVRFLGFVTEEEKLELLRTVWAVVFASPKEGWGITNVEAAACGTPAIASDAPGLRESVRDGETGLINVTFDRLTAWWMDRRKVAF